MNCCCLCEIVFMQKKIRSERLKIYLLKFIKVLKRIDLNKENIYFK